MGANTAKTKLKSHRGAAKRFRRKANGQIKKKSSDRNHMLTKKKTPKRKRQLRIGSVIKACDKKMIERLLDGS